MSSDQVTRFPSDPIGGWGPRKDPRAVCLGILLLGQPVYTGYTNTLEG